MSRYATPRLRAALWVTAVGVVAALALTAVLAHRGVAAWWLMPAAVVAILLGSVRRAQA